MKNIALSAVLILLLASCSWTVRFNPMVGKRFMIIEPEKVPIYSEPSLKGLTFTLDKPDAFVIETLECPDKPIIWCISRSITIKGAMETEILYKVRFASGKEGYISDKSSVWAYIISLDSPEILGTALFHADYDRVWDAVVDTLDERGFVIKHMRKEEGYITTEVKKDDSNFRIKVSARLVRTNDGVRVSVSEYSQSSQVYGKSNGRFLTYWQEEAPSGEYRKGILDDIESRLRRAR
ncbi:MAG: outer membrane protein assembly factor BamC [Deltaproteobacteria bacterium]|nr:outer membrane protein assembly factor BamC [Deltaproteobacteria bacterium]